MILRCPWTKFYVIWQYIIDNNRKKNMKFDHKGHLKYVHIGVATVSFIEIKISCIEWELSRSLKVRAIKLPLRMIPILYFYSIVTLHHITHFKVVVVYICDTKALWNYWALLLIFVSRIDFLLGLIDI